LRPVAFPNTNYIIELLSFWVFVRRSEIGAIWPTNTIDEHFTILVRVLQLIMNADWAWPNAIKVCNYQCELASDSGVELSLLAQTLNHFMPNKS